MPGVDAPPAADGLGRPLIAAAMREQVAREFAHVPPDKRGALLVVADERGARAHLAARLGKDGRFKVAGGVGWEWGAKRPVGYVGVEATW